MDQSYKEYSSSQRITRWVARLEEQTAALLEDVDLEELSVRDRLNLAVRYIAQLQRFLSLAQQIEADIPTNSTQHTLEIIKQRMRGMWPSEVIDNKEGDVHANRDPGE